MPTKSQFTMSYRTPTLYRNPYVRREYGQVGGRFERRYAQFAIERGSARAPL